MVRAGYLERQAHPDDARLKPVAITYRGQRLRAEVESIYDEVAQAWAGRIGRTRLERLRTELQDVLADPRNGTFPPVRPAW